MRSLIIALALSAVAAPAFSAPLTPMPGIAELSPARAISPIPAQQNQCARQFKFATQTTAWARWRQARQEAQRLGPSYGVSNGVYPCYAGGGRGYCFRVFHPCR